MGREDDPAMQEESMQRYPFFGKPPAREPHPAPAVPALRGKRVILSTPDGFVYDMRAISQIKPDERGRDVVEIASEEDYFRWMFTGEQPRTEFYPSNLVWLD